MRHPDRAYLFFGLALTLTAALVIAGKAELVHFLGVFGYAASCLGFYQAQPPAPKGPMAPGPAAGLLLPLLVLPILAACDGGELRLHLAAPRLTPPRQSAAPITASSVQLYRQGSSTCPAGLTCLAADTGGNLVAVVGSTATALVTSATVPDIDASKITTGTLALARGGLATSLANITANYGLFSPDGTAGAVGPRRMVVADLPQTITAGSCTTCSLTWNGAGQLTVATSGSGSGGGAYFSPVKLYASGLDPLGDYSVGCKYVVVTDSITVSGVRFRRYGTATTITAKLWRGGSALASASVAVTPPGVVEVSFTSAVTLSLGDIFWTTIHDEELVSPRYARGAALSWEPGDWSGAGFFTAHASGVYLLHPGQYGSGDQQPNTGSSGERFPVEGIIP